MAAIRFGRSIKELRIHLCQYNDQSKGIRDFITNNYVKIKKDNPHTPILIRECTGAMPKIYARYEKGLESSVSLCNLNESTIASTITGLVTAVP